MFRPVPETTLFRRIPYRLIASVLLLLALVVSVILLFSLERDKLLLRGSADASKAPTELFYALWQSRGELIVETLLVFLVISIGIAAVITFLHYDTTRRTLEEVKGLARNILQSIPTGVLTISQEGFVSAINPAAERALHRTSSELLGNGYDTVFPETDPIRQTLDGALREHRYVSQKDVLYECRDLPSRTIRVSTAELTGDDKTAAGVILQVQDVTEWLDLERRVLVAEKLAALHTLSAGVAHELRNPLSAMDLNLHLLDETLKERGGLAQDVAHYLHVVNAECRRLSAILDNFMRFAKPTSISIHEVDVRKVLNHIMALMQFEAQERNIWLEERVEGEVPPVFGDETQISQVLVNIMVNAFQAMPDGGRCSIITQVQRNADARWVEVVVSDTGVGIKKDDLSHLFEPFYTTKAGGTGLGLAIAYRIMQDHGGAIRVSSVLGVGTTVVVQLPVGAKSLEKLEVGS